MRRRVRKGWLTLLLYMFDLQIQLHHHDVDHLKLRQDVFDTDGYLGLHSAGILVATGQLYSLHVQHRGFVRVLGYGLSTDDAGDCLWNSLSNPDAGRLYSYYWRLGPCQHG